MCLPEVPTKMNGDIDLQRGKKDDESHESRVAGKLLRYSRYNPDENTDLRRRNKIEGAVKIERKNI